MFTANKARTVADIASAKDAKQKEKEKKQEIKRMYWAIKNAAKKGFYSINRCIGYTETIIQLKQAGYTVTNGEYFGYDIDWSNAEKGIDKVNTV